MPSSASSTKRADESEVHTVHTEAEASARSPEAGPAPSAEPHLAGDASNPPFPAPTPPVPVASAPPPGVPVRATFHGAPGEYLTPILFVDEADPTIERIFQPPARALTEDDWQALSADQRKYVRSSPLYQVKTDEEVRRAKRGD